MKRAGKNIGAEGEKESVRYFSATIAQTPALQPVLSGIRCLNIIQRALPQMSLSFFISPLCVEVLQKPNSHSFLALTPSHPPC